MADPARPGTLRQIPPTQISRNPDNPRLFFRDEDMDPLIESIRNVGVLVPLTVYRESADHYVLLDGERRWRAARRLNRPTVPAIVQPKPPKLENILRMFNIHNVRTEWDQLASALKLGEVVALIKKEQGHDPTTNELASLLGLTPSAVRRLLDIWRLPEEHKAIIREELKKPKAQQKLTEDFFFELQKAVKTIKRYEPEVLPTREDEKAFGDSMIEKYGAGKIDSIIQFRSVSRIARGEKSGVSKRRVVSALTRLMKENDYSIPRAYEATVEHPLWEKDLRNRIRDLSKKLEEIGAEGVDDDVRSELLSLRDRINRILT
jgi:ParB family chromosome partitioning protein